ncbi:MAG: hypothetical protein QOF48_565 [Verrucomicrobiota bacterium]
MRGGERAPSAAHLLVVGHHRTRRLVVDHKTQVGFVETHAQRSRRNKSLHAVLQQRLLQFHTVPARLSGVRLSPDAA